MNSKTFLIRIEWPNETKWIRYDEELKLRLRYSAEQISKESTHGPEPKVTVTLQGPLPHGFDDFCGGTYQSGR